MPHICAGKFEKVRLQHDVEFGPGPLGYIYTLLRLELSPSYTSNLNRITKTHGDGFMVFGLPRLSLLKISSTILVCLCLCRLSYAFSYQKSIFNNKLLTRSGYGLFRALRAFTRPKRCCRRSMTVSVSPSLAINVPFSLHFLSKFMLEYLKWRGNSPMDCWTL
jgi:hypothetical protein